MYTVSEQYKEKILENTREFRSKVEIQHSGGEIYLDENDIVLGGMTKTDSTQNGDEFTVGGTVGADLSLSIFNSENLDEIDFTGAVIKPEVGLLLDREEIFDEEDEFVGYDDTYEYVPLGHFIVDEQSIEKDVVKLKAIDNMLRLTRPYDTNLSFPATLFQIYENICFECDVLPATLGFPNDTYVVDEKPDVGSYREMLGYVAQLAGCFAKFNRNGALELRWYQESDLELTADHRYNFKPSDEVTEITGVMFETDDTVYLTGTQDYAIDLSDNPLITKDYEIVIPNVYNNIEGLSFNSYSSEWIGDPAVEVGDIITQVASDGTEYRTLITGSTYKYGGKGKLEAKSKSANKRGFEGTTSEKIAKVIRQVRNQENKFNDKMTGLETATHNANELLSNMLGGHFIEDKEEGVFYIANNPDLNLATEYWKYGIGGYGHYKDGVLDTAVTADGSIVAMLVNAGIVTADMVKTGLLQSQGGETWINLDTGYFQLGGVSLDENGFHLEIPDNFLDNLIVNANNRLYQSESFVPLKSNSGEINLQLIRDELNPYYIISGSTIDLYGQFPKVQYAENLEGQDVIVSLEVKIDNTADVELDGEVFNVEKDVWTQIYVKKTFPTNTLRHVNVRKPYSRESYRDTVGSGGIIIESLNTTETKLYYRKIQVQKGKILTNWSLTPEEILIQNQRFTSQFNQFKDGIEMVVTRDTASGKFEVNADGIIAELNKTDGVGKLKTTRVTIDETGLTVDNGAITIQDKNNKNVITSDGLKFYIQHTSSGELGGWQFAGTVSIGGEIEARTALLNFTLPENIIIENAILKTWSLPTYRTGYSDGSNGTFHARNLRLYHNDSLGGNAIDFPFGSSYGLYIGTSGFTNITTDAWGGNWSPTGTNVVLKTADITDILETGNNYLMIRSTDTVNATNSRYTSGILMQIEIEGYLQG